MDEENDCTSPRSEEAELKHENTFLRVCEDDYMMFSSINSEAQRWTSMGSFSTIDYDSDNSRSEILQEYLFHILHFCVENQLVYEQMSAVVMIAEAFFTRCILNPSVSTENSKLIFREQINGNIFENEDPTAKISIEVLQKLTIFFMQNFIRHISLYQTVFAQHQNEKKDAKLIAVQTPLLFPSLMEATHYNGEEIMLPTADTTARTDYTEGEYEQDGTARTDYTEYTEGDE